MNMPPMAIMRMAMSKLQSINPNGFQAVDTAMKNGGSPISFWNQISKQMNPGQVQGILKNASQYGCPQNIISQFQGANNNLKDTRSQSGKPQDNKPN